MLALLPAAASAQSAGDEQYEDPFGDEQPQSQATPAPTQAPAAEPALAPRTIAPDAPTEGDRELVGAASGARTAVPAGAVQLPTEARIRTFLGRPAAPIVVQRG